MKKFLSLVLALIMTMSLVTISAGATEYRDLTDKDEIQYEEAVAVLNRIGVITGYEDGSFRPETELTRGAAAKIIVSLLIGPDAAANLPNATAPYPDVPASHTFAGVISYCKTAGIISGYGDGTFKPGNSLTGFAFAKMLLGALGYKSEIEGFVDTGWTMNVARVGNVTGLFDRLDFDGAASVNREQACQLALNTLKATMVTYGGTTMVTGAQTLAVQGTQAMYVTSNNRDINANINRRVISAANNEMTLEFGEEHFKDLRLEHDKYDPAYDDFGHPSNEWSYKKVTIGTFKLPADFTYTKQIAHREDTAATKEKALGLRGYDTWSVDHTLNYTNWSSAAGGTQFAYSSPFDNATQITVNGYNARVKSDVYTQTADREGVKLGNLFSYDAGTAVKDNAPSLAEIADLTDNGVTVEVYVCPVDADFITNVVVTRTQLMKVKTIGSDYVTLEQEKPDSRSPRKDGDLDAITGYNAFAIDVDLVDVKDSNYDCYNTLKGLKAGDRVAVVPYTPDEGKTWEAGVVYVPETVSGTFTKVDTYANTNKPKGSAVAITIGGTSYPINEWNKDMLDVTGNEIKATKKDVTAYLANDGTVLWATEIGNSDDWMIVGDYYQAPSVAAKIGWFVHGWTTGGVEVDLDLGTIRGEAERYAPGELVHYDIAQGGNGEYELSKPNYNQVSFNKDGTSNTEPNMLDKDRNSTGEGIYNVSQWANDLGTKTPARYQVSSRNSLLPLENYKTYKQTTCLESALEQVTPSADPTVPTPIAKIWNYNRAPYDGVKFIYVSFDPSTGEVETIDFKSGVQNVEHEDLKKTNTTWRNVGTNVDSFVASPAEAYVNDDGNVKAVVIKEDAAEANLSMIAYITATPGDRNYTNPKAGAEGDRPTGTSYAKQYRVGPNFDEELTGWFDKDYPVNTVLTIRKQGDLIVGKYFHSNTYSNSNPDGLYVRGIQPLKTLNGAESKSDFYVNKNGSNDKIWTLNGLQSLRADGNPIAVVPGGKVDLLSDEYVMGTSADVDEKGLIKTDKNTVWLDMRVGGKGDINDLDDLLGYDNDTIELKVLVDGNKSTDYFRHAYLIAVLKAEKLNVAATPDVDFTVAAGGNEYTATVDGNTYTYEVPADTEITLIAEETHKASAVGELTTLWASKLSTLSNTTGWITKVQSNPVAGKSVTVTLTVTNTDSSKTDGKIKSSVYTIVLVSKADAPAGKGSVVAATDSAKGFSVNAGDCKLADGVATIVFDIDRNAVEAANWTDKDGKKTGWLPADANGTLDLDVYVVNDDGTKTLVDHQTSVAIGSLGFKTLTSTVAGKIKESSKLEVKVSNVKWTTVNVIFDMSKWTGSALTPYTDATNASSTTTAGGTTPIKLFLASSTEDGGLPAGAGTFSFAAPVAGQKGVATYTANTNTAGDSAATPAVGAVLTASALTITGVDPVELVVNFNVLPAVTTYTVDDGAAVNLEVGGTQVGSATVALSVDGVNAGLKAGDSVKVGVTVGGSGLIPVTSAPIEITVTHPDVPGMSLKYLLANDGNATAGAAAATGSDTFTMVAKDIDLADCQITAAERTDLMPTVSSVTLEGDATAGWNTDDTITINFSGAVANTGTIAIKKADGSTASTDLATNTTTTTAGASTTLTLTAADLGKTSKDTVAKILIGKGTLKLSTGSYVQTKDIVITINATDLVDGKTVPISNISYQ